MPSSDATIRNAFSRDAQLSAAQFSAAMSGLSHSLERHRASMRGLGQDQVALDAAVRIFLAKAKGLRGQLQRADAFRPR